MKHIFRIIIMALALTSCYTDTVESFSSFTFQFPVHFETAYINREVPRTSRDFGNLYKYDEYQDNRDRIDKAEILQLNFWVDSLVKPDNTPYNPLLDTIIFDYVRYTLVFARPKYGNVYSTDSTDFEPDPSVSNFVLGEFLDVDLREFYRNPKHIINLPADVSATISDFLKTKPYFYVVTEYSKIKGQTAKELYFPFLEAKFDVIIRFKVNV